MTIVWTILDAEAKNASTAAGIAIDSLVIVGQEAGDAQGKANRARSEAEAVASQATELGQQLTATGKQLNAIDEKRAKLVGELSWRELTDKQNESMVSVLKAAPGSRVIIGITSPDSAEKRQYAWTMFSAFNDARCGLPDVLYQRDC
jgi:hypothetical protein